MLLHIILAHIYNNPTVAVTCIAGLLFCWLSIGWCLRSFVCEWHIAHIGIVSRFAVGLHVGSCSLYFAREVVYS